jgi:hypothetical protein
MKTKIVTVHPSSKPRHTPDRSFPGVSAQWLGTIKWYGAWRCYAFYPQPSTVFEPKCLDWIKHECEQLTKAHREMKAKNKATR